MRSHSSGSLSATTQVKVLSPKTTRIAQGQGFHFLETEIDIIEKGETISACWGLSPWRANELNLMELGRTNAYQKEAQKGVEEMTKEYGVLVVGLTHIRGVNSVMAIESQYLATLEGVSSLMQSDEECNAIL